jgi:methanogenic corrinoid protein MtbC1
MEPSQNEAARALEARRAALAEAVTARHYERNPSLMARWGEAGRAKCLQDAVYHLSYLGEALASGSPSLFIDYVAWAKVMLAGRGIPAEDLVTNLEVLREVLRRELPANLGEVVGSYVASSLEHLPLLPSHLPSVFAVDAPLSDLAQAYIQALLAGDRRGASALVLGALEQGTPLKEIYLRVFQSSQHEVGRLWQMNRLSVAQEHFCTAATQLIMSQLYPHLFGAERNGRTMVATCVSGDLHEIGVRMVADFFEMEGWDTFYLGANVPAASVVSTLIERQADILAVSATMTFHLRAVESLIAAVGAAEEARRVKILVGGYPFNADPDLWRTLGADACAVDAEQSLAVAERLVRGDA